MIRARQFKWTKKGISLKHTMHENARFRGSMNVILLLKICNSFHIFAPNIDGCAR